MSKIALLPVIIPAISAMLTWALAKHLQLAGEQRAHAASRPRARPYATKLPDSLIGR
jgi:hypothetical protein